MTRDEPGQDKASDGSASAGQAQRVATTSSAGQTYPAGTASGYSGPVNQFGTPITGPGQHVLPVAPGLSGPGQGVPYRGTPTGMSVATKVLIGVAAGGLAFVIVGIMAAVAIPVFLNQRAKAVAAAGTLSLPGSLGSRHQLTDPANEARMSQVAAQMPKGTKVAVYGATPTDPSLIVYIYQAHLSQVDQSSFLDGFEGAANSDAAGIHAVDPGPLGGEARCQSSAKDELTACMFVGPAGVVGVIVRETGVGAEQDALSIRAQVEHRKA